jgi:hypothetical protein
VSETGVRCPQCKADLEGNEGVCNRCGALLNFTDGRLVQKGQICFDCGYESESPFDRCPNCGKEIGVECRSCGRVNGILAKSCVQCGAELSPEKTPDAPLSGKPARSVFRLGLLVVGILIAAVFAGFGYLMSRNGTLAERIIEFLGFLAILSVAAWWLIFSQREKIKTDPIKRRREGGMVEIYRTPLANRAEFLLEVLRSEGVDAMILNRHFGSFLPFAMSHGLQVLVPEEQETRAGEIMKAYDFSDNLPGDNPPAP